MGGSWTAFLSSVTGTSRAPPVKLALECRALKGGFVVSFGVTGDGTGSFQTVNFDLFKLEKEKLSVLIGERARHSFGVLNANLIYMYGGMYATTFSSAGTPLRKGGGVRPQPFLRLAAYGKWEELSI